MFSNTQIFSAATSNFIIMIEGQKISLDTG